MIPPDLRGRVARPAPAWWNVAKTLIQLVAFWSFFLVLLPLGVARAEDALGLGGYRFASRVSDAAGAALVALGSGFGFASALFMALRGRGTPMPTDSTRELVVTGPYRFVRNPMVLTGSAQALGVGLLVGSWTVLAGVIGGMLSWNRYVRPWEEADLETRFGEPYRRYRDIVPCWRLRLKPYV